MKKWVWILITILILILGLCICGYCIHKTIENKDKQIAELNAEIEKFKEAANPSKETIDSLEYNIKYRDSIIFNIKKEYVKDVEIIKNMPDSTVVELFNKLVWSE